MTDEAVKVIITVEVEGRKLDPKVIEVGLNAKIDEAFREEMGRMEQEIFGVILDAV